MIYEEDLIYEKNSNSDRFERSIPFGYCPGGGDSVLISKKKQKLAPGEMETVKLTKEMLENAGAGELSFSIED